MSTGKNNYIPPEHCRTTPKYKHDCEECKFLGHEFNHDVYICHKPHFNGDKRATYIARRSDEPCDNLSYLVDSLHQHFRGNEGISGVGWSTRFKDHVFSNRLMNSFKAIFAVVIQKGMESVDSLSE